MKRTIVAAAGAALVAGAIGAGAAPNTKDPTSRCVVPGAQPITANEDARVYGLEREFARDTSRTAIYACSFRTGRKVPLGTAAVAGGDADEDVPVRYIRSIRLTQDFNDGSGAGVAFVDTDCTKDPCRFRVVVKSLRTGRTIMRRAAGSGFDLIALSRPTDQDGFALAWLETSPPGGGCPCRVHLVKDSGDKVLDEGADIDSDLFGEVANDGPGIVRFSGTNEFVWKRGGVIRSASFND
ncbi:MAG TPA: hypothetical protein VF715_13420 [Thermoleophilaceae bacterium]